MTISLDKTGWKRVALGDVATASKEKCDPTDGSVDRYIAGEHMDTNSLRIERWGTVGDGYLGPAFHRRFHPGQVLYGSRRTYLRKVAVAEFGGVCANTTFVVDATPELLLPEFLPLVMTSEPFHAYAIAESKGSVNPYVNWSDLANYEFDLPPLDEQKRIADLMWALERHRRQSSENIGVLQEAVRDLGEEMLSAYQWTQTLGDVLDGIVAGRSLPGSATPAAEGLFGVLRVSAVSAEGFVASENKELLDQAGFIAKYALRKGDLLITRANTAAYVGRPAIVDSDYPNLMLSDKTLRLDVNPDRALSGFVFEYLLSSGARESIAAVATGTGAAMKNISQSDIRSLVMPDVPMADQRRILAVLRRARDGVARARSELGALDALRSSLLADIFGSAA